MHISKHQHCTRLKCVSYSVTQVTPNYTKVNCDHKTFAVQGTDLILAVTSNDKPTSLFHQEIKYSRKKFHDTGPMLIFLFRKMK